MQPLSKSTQGTYTIKWMFGLPEVLEQMHSYQIQEGSEIKVIHRFRNHLIISANNHRLAIANEVAERIQV